MKQGPRKDKENHNDWWSGCHVTKSPRWDLTQTAIKFIKWLRSIIWQLNLRCHKVAQAASHQKLLACCPFSTRPPGGRQLTPLIVAIVTHGTSQQRLPSRRQLIRPKDTQRRPMEKKKNGQQPGTNQRNLMETCQIGAKGSNWPSAVSFPLKKSF